MLQAAGVGSSPLARALLGPWAKAPKQARDDYERFIRTVSSLLGGEASSEEVQVSNTLVLSISLTSAGSGRRTRHQLRFDGTAAGCARSSLSFCEQP